eukprot:Tbor_TRINITY_DN4238_c0_g1::TRINITY_DN4238_c0_g1_i1::g.23841::m.23841/K12184/VPS28; ESCRT-I complex subunit VPS28
METQRIELTSSEKHHVDNFSDLYAVIVQIEKIERANNRDLIHSDEYDVVLRKLLNKFNNISSLLAHQTQYYPFFTNIDEFWSDFCSNCVAARNRVKIGHPKDAEAAAALLHHQGEEANNTKRVDPKMVLETAQHFITLMDSVKLQQVAVDQLYPILSDLVQTLSAGFKEFEYLPKLEEWSRRMNDMHPTDELNERDTRELAFDMDRGYQAFYRYLGER